MASQHEHGTVAASVFSGRPAELHAATAQAASPASEMDSPQSRALVVRREHRAGEQPSPQALETLREWALARGCGDLEEAGWRATTQTRDHGGPTSGQVDRYYYSPSGETLHTWGSVALGRMQVPTLQPTRGKEGGAGSLICYYHSHLRQASG